MARILILCRRDDRMEYDRRLSMLAGMAKIEAQNEYFGADYEDLVFDYDGTTLSVTDAVSGTDVAEYDAVFLIGWFKSKALDDVARAVAHYLHAHGVPFANSEAYHGRSFTKLSQCVIAALNGVRVTPFVFSMDAAHLMPAVRGRFTRFPFIAKAVAASRGNHNHLIESYEQLESVLAEENEPPMYFIVQEFVPNDGDFRILVMGGEVSRVIHRKAAGDSHLNNTSKGGSATLLSPDDLPTEVRDQSVLLAKLFGREVTGVDMVCHKETGDYYFLEANNMPQLATGSNVPAKLTALDAFLAKLAAQKQE